MNKEDKTYSDFKEFMSNINKEIEYEKKHKPIRYHLSRLWHRVDIKQRYYNVKYGIRNLIRWFPVIWKDRDWDEHYLLIIMSKKMNNMSELHSKYGSSLNSEMYAQQLKECSELAKKINDYDYAEEFENVHDEEKAIEKDFDKLFTEMRKNIRSWWD